MKHYNLVIYIFHQCCRVGSISDADVDGISGSLTPRNNYIVHEATIKDH